MKQGVGGGVRGVSGGRGVDLDGKVGTNLLIDGERGGLLGEKIELAPVRSSDTDHDGVETVRIARRDTHKYHPPIAMGLAADASISRSQLSWIAG